MICVYHRVREAAMSSLVKITYLLKENKRADLLTADR